ncbi:hypothetical protein K491DRAFT_723356 [Lophiostoma macrostomum CBS 122681]|uniref:Uncharacterized protein n=1 Tax=Lophiostoma macrostomum CBS 122681 TaxID=1314788 RepID=A0A6A6SMF4_9PLEO|nr:hypothetical protein K491DRAFT_723356 [Lophiostoma macrostomum CBS 122681]
MSTPNLSSTSKTSKSPNHRPQEPQITLERNTKTADGVPSSATPSSPSSSSSFQTASFLSPINKSSNSTNPSNLTQALVSLQAERGLGEVVLEQDVVEEDQKELGTSIQETLQKRMVYTWEMWMHAREVTDREFMDGPWS